MTTAADYQEDAPLHDSGTHVLAASAGTGKTHAIKKLVARYIREKNVRIDAPGSMLPDCTSVGSSPESGQPFMAISYQRARTRLEPM